jgi:hypothetical protein
MKFDLQDSLLALGIALLEGGVATFSWRVALVLGGLICLTLVHLIERTKPNGSTDK